MADMATSARWKLMEWTSSFVDSRRSSRHLHETRRGHQSLTGRWRLDLHQLQRAAVMKWPSNGEKVLFLPDETLGATLDIEWASRSIR